MPDIFSLKKLALAPIIESLPVNEGIKFTHQFLSQYGEEFVFDCLSKNGLAPLWHTFLLDNQLVHSVPDTFFNKTKMSTMQAAAMTLAQMNTLKKIHHKFEQNKIDYLVFKGVNLRYTIYDDPSLRPSTDIDILIPDALKKEAINCLMDLNFAASFNPDNISHEAGFSLNASTIDLHWRFIRPGRTRYELTDYLFDHKIMVNGFWGLDMEASLIVALVHPVFTKQLNSPSSMLIHMVDLYRLLNNNDINWDNIISILDQSGTKTVAWCSLYFLNKITGYSVQENIIRQLKPGKIHERYLRLWINNDLINRLWKYRSLVQVTFDLALQDNLNDVLRAIFTLFKEKQYGGKITKELNTIYSASN